MLKPAFGNNAMGKIEPSMWYSRFKRWERSAEDCEHLDRPSARRIYE
jgi:hypothetical protein